MGYGVSRKLESYRIPRAKIRNVHLFLQERDALKAREKSSLSREASIGGYR